MVLPYFFEITLQIVGLISCFQTLKMQQNRAGCDVGLILGEHIFINFMVLEFLKIRLDCVMQKFLVNLLLVILLFVLCISFLFLLFLPQFNHFVAVLLLFFFFLLFFHSLGAYLGSSQLFLLFLVLWTCQPFSPSFGLLVLINYAVNLCEFLTLFFSA